MTSYETIKLMRKTGGGEPTLADLKAAVVEQEALVGTTACEFARAQATAVSTVKDTPFPVEPEKILAALTAHQEALRRLSKLYRWLDKAGS